MLCKIHWTTSNTTEICDKIPVAVQTVAKWGLIVWKSHASENYKYKLNLEKKKDHSASFFLSSVLSLSSTSPVRLPNLFAKSRTCSCIRSKHMASKARPNMSHSVQTICLGRLCHVSILWPGTTSPNPIVLSVIKQKYRAVIVSHVFSQRSNRRVPNRLYAMTIRKQTIIGTCFGIGVSGWGLLLQSLLFPASWVWPVGFMPLFKDEDFKLDVL